MKHLSLTELLRSQNPVHLRLGQAETLYVIGEDVLWQRSGHWCVQQQEDQSHIQALQKEAVVKKCRL